jgi:hypothetical protein
VLVGTSGSPGSLQALRYGEGLARTLDAVLIPVIAWEVPGDDRAHRAWSSRELGKACRDLASQCAVVAIPPPALAGELGHGRLVWAFWRRSLTPEQVLRGHDRPAA